MSISEQTTINLKIGTAIVVVMLIVSAVTGGTTAWLDFQRVKDRVDNAQNRLFVLEYPNHPWSVRYRETHRERYEKFEQ